MANLSIPNSKVSQSINSVLRKLELTGVFILFIGFFDTDLSSWRTGFNTASYGIILFLIIMRWKRCAYVATRDLSLLLIAGTAILSYFWSAAPEYTLNESKSFIRSILFGVYLASQYNPKQLMQLLSMLFGAAVVLNLLYTGFAVATSHPELAIAVTNDEPSWKGLLEHKQYLGRMMMHASVILMLFALTTQKFRWMAWTGFSLSTMLLLLSKSKTSWVGFLLSLAMLPIMRLVKQHYKVRTIIYIYLILIGGTISILVFGNLETIVVDVLRKPPDFNGRFEIWTLSIESALRRPWLGYGYAGFWTSDESQYILKNTWATSAGLSRFHAHNGFIELFLQLGTLGLSLFLFNFIAVLARVIRLIHLTKTIESLWMFEFLILSFIFQFTETLTLVSINTICSIYVSIGLSAIIWQDRIKHNITNI